MVTWNKFARFMLDPKEFIITRKRKKYKFALFANSPICFEHEQWQQRPVDIIEVGAGTGHFGIALAERLPDRQVVAVDVKADRLIQGARTATDIKRSNIMFLRARAELLAEVFAPCSLEAIWVTFPDPFPKKHSRGRRLTHPKYLKTYQNLLKEGGALYFKTDARDLFNWSLEQLIREGWQLQELSFDLHESDLSDYYKIETTYEVRFRAEGISINFVKAIPPRG